MAGTSIAEVVNRDAAAQRLADYIHREAMKTAIEMMRNASEGDWERLAELAGNKKKPSEITQTLVFQKLKEFVK